jgi:predicted RNase H-like HicB family nuclease
MEYVYPAIFYDSGAGGHTVIFPDLPGCMTQGDGLSQAIYMAEKALAQWIEYLSDKKMDIPAASAIGSVTAEAGEFVTLIRCKVGDSKAVRRTVSIPKWMDIRVTEDGLSLSRVLQDALTARLGKNA